jgi:hypothetical protein
LDLGATASYLSLSDWTIRDLEAAGVLRRVRIPLPNNGELRKVLFDVREMNPGYSVGSTFGPATRP